MAKLQDDKAFQSDALRELAAVGEKTLGTAKEVSDDVKESLAAIEAQYDQIPSGARQEGVERAVRAARKRIQSGKYNLEKRRLSGAVKKLEEAVPMSDQACAKQIKSLSGVCDRLYARITDLEGFLQKGSMNLPPERFEEELAGYRKVWEEEGEALEGLLAAVKAGLKGLETASCAYSKDPVNLSTGNFIYDKTDLTIKGRPGLAFRRFYNALEEREGTMGRGWVHNYEMSVCEDGEVLRVFLPDGKEEQYRADGNGGFSSIRGSLGTLQRTDEGYVYEPAGENDGTGRGGNGVCL